MNLVLVQITPSSVQPENPPPPPQPKLLVEFILQFQPSVLPTWCWTSIMLGRHSKGSSLTKKWVHVMTCQWRTLNTFPSMVFSRYVIFLSFSFYFLRNLRKISNSTSSICFSCNGKVLYRVQPSQGTLARLRLLRQRVRNWRVSSFWKRGKWSGWLRSLLVFRG